MQGDYWVIVLQWKGCKGHPDSGGFIYFSRINADAYCSANADISVSCSAENRRENKTFNC